MAPSRDTATTFKVQEQLRFICAGGVLRSADRLVSGDSLKWSYLCICSIFVGEIHTFMYFSKFWVMRLHKHTNVSLPGQLDKDLCSYSSPVLCSLFSMES